MKSGKDLMMTLAIGLGIVIYPASSGWASTLETTADSKAHFALKKKDTLKAKANGDVSTKPVKSDCKKEGCNVYAEISKSEQKMYVYVSGELQHTFDVSTGRRGHETPNLDLKPAGPVYEKYRSRKYPEGDYKGMGNMPYAVFLKGGYAIHGTTLGSIPKLGKPASHGCVRLHPDNAKIFFELVNSIGIENTWVTIKP